MKKIYLVVSIAVLFLVLLRPQLTGTLYNNIGHLIWLRVSDEQKEMAEAALPYFERVLASNPRHPQARIGAALMNIQMGNEDEAFTHWETGEVDPSILAAYGDKEKISGDYNKALTLYKDSARLGSGEGHILTGSVCQLILYEPEQLSNDKQAFCEAYFADNADNLIVNNNFDSGDFIGWSRRYWSGFNGRYHVENEPESNSNTAIIQGENDKEVGAISQELTLKADSAVRFSARIKADLPENAQARLLHIVWTRPDGKAGGNQLVTIDEDMEWDYVERTLRLPQAEKDSYTFSPAILTGKGNIWIDDVRLEIIPED